MSTPPSDPIAAELRALRESMDALTARVGELADDNKLLREQLAQSQAARTDLVGQVEHLLHELARAQQKS